MKTTLNKKESIKQIVSVNTQTEIKLHKFSKLISQLWPKMCYRLQTVIKQKVRWVLIY